MLDDNSRLVELRRRELILGGQAAEARKLFESGGVSRKQAEDEELAWQSNVAERKALEFAKLREKLELDLAREGYERRHLRSPINGVVTKVALRVGESAVPNEPVLTVVDVSRVRFIGTFPVSSLSPLKPGHNVSIRLAMEGRSVLRQAKLIFVSPVTDSASGLVELIAEFDNHDGSVRPGISGQIVAPQPAAERRPIAGAK
jgi:multidrug resistance efflux pump